MHQVLIQMTGHSKTFWKKLWQLNESHARREMVALVRVRFSRNRKKYDDMTGLIKYKLIYLRVYLPAPLLALREA